MTVRPQKLPDCVHPKVRKIFDYWVSIHPDSGLPGRQHFDPIDVPDLLPNIRLVDVVGDPPRFQVRLCGDRVRDHFGSCQQGQFFDEMYPPFANRPSYADFMAVIESGRPRVHQGFCELNPAKDFVPLERIVLPLASDGRTVDMLLVVSLFGETAGSTGTADVVPSRVKSA